MRIRKFDVGLEAISRWREVDEVHLPATGRLGPTFLPTQSALDEILRRPSLDERLINLMQPQRLDPDLLDAPVLAQTRLDVHDYLASASLQGGPVFVEAAAILADEVDLDATVCSALAALLRG